VNGNGNLGLLKWWLIAMAVGVFMVFVLPYFPGSPVACLNVHTGNACATHMNAVMGWCFGAPLAVLCLGGIRRGPR
jgi:hypothetical protein